MGRLEKEIRDEMVRDQKERITVYGSIPYQVFMVHAIKAPMLESLDVIMSPSSSKPDKLKALFKLRKALKGFEDKFPEPQKGIHAESGLRYVWHPNSELLIDLRDEFFTHCDLLVSRNRMLRLGINFVIVMYDYDPPYRMMMDWWAHKLGIRNWNYDIPVTVNPHAWSWWKE